jgi:3-polyprenyl-4-hydroxybenzoate decarboxylase
LASQHFNQAQRSCGLSILLSRAWHRSQLNSILTKGPSDVLDHATSEMAMDSKLGIDATKKLPGEGFKRPWPPLIKMDEAVKEKISALFGDSTKK